MNIFEETHHGRCVSLPDFINAFFIALYNDETHCVTFKQAFTLSHTLFYKVLDEAMEHNKTPHLRSFGTRRVQHPDASSYDLLKGYANPQKRNSIFCAVTGGEYLLISNSGAIEIHQMSLAFIGIEPEVYKNNKNATLIFSKINKHGTNVWGESAQSREYIEKSRKGNMYKV